MLDASYRRPPSTRCCFAAATSAAAAAAAAADGPLSRHRRTAPPAVRAPANRRRCHHRWQAPLASRCTELTIDDGGLAAYRDDAAHSRAEHTTRTSTARPVP